MSTVDAPTMAIGTTRVLHVDDDPDILDLTATVLRREVEELDVVGASSARDALDRLDGNVDCVVSDLDMPGMDGLEFLEAVREEHPDLPFILFTGKGSEEIASEAISAGVTDYLQKGGGLDQYELLANSIENAVRRYRAESELDEVFGRMTDAFVAVDTDWRFTYVNEEAERVLRCSEEELLGRNHWEAFPESIETAFYEAYHRAMDEQVPVTVEEYYPPLETWFAVRAYPSETGLSIHFHDVTDRKEREQRLEQYRAVLENQQDVVSIVDRDHRLVFVNSRIEEVTGTDQEEMLGRPAGDLLEEVAGDPAAVTDYTDAIDRIMAGDEDEIRLELDIETGPLGSATIEVRLDPYREEGETAGVITTARDVTARTDRERELREAKTRLELALEGTDTGVWVRDLETDRMVWTPPLERLFGLEEGEFEETYEAHARRIHPEDLPALERAADRALESGETFHEEFRILRDDGDVRWVEGRGRVRYDDDGEPATMIGITTDIHARKQRETDLELFRNLLDRSTDGIYVIEPESGRFLDVNAEVCRRLGYEREELLELSVPDIDADVGESGPTYPDLADRIRERGSVVLEGRHRRRDGTDFPVEVSVEHVELDAEYFIAIARDVTDRREREARLAGLTDVLNELLEAETAGEACGLVVDAVDGRLDLPVTAVALFDDGTGDLRRAAETADAPEAIDDSAFDRDGGAAWGAFVEGEERVVEVGPGPDDGTDFRPDAVLVVPLGSHGVLVTAGGADDPAGAEAAFVRTVAGSLLSALDGIERERRLRDRERRLNEQNERLERLNRINDEIRGIARALVRASTRSEVERSVCEELVAAGAYDVAWIGECDQATGTLSVRESCGAGRGVTAALIPEGDGEGNPVLAAVERRNPRVTEHVVDEPPLEPWQKAAMDRGYRSSMSVPLVYEDVGYGVLTVFAGDPGAFDGLEREVLAELGRTVAHAINAVERRKALVSDRVVTLEFDMHDAGITFLESVPGPWELAFDTLVAGADGALRAFFSVRGLDPDEVGAAAGASPAIDTVRQVTARGEDLLFEATVTESSFVAFLVDHGAVLEEFTATPDGGRFAVSVPDTATVREFVETIEDRSPAVDLVSTREHDRSPRRPGGFVEAFGDLLTDRQEEVVRTAHAMGYFESPRENTGQEVAAALGVTQPTFNHHLRAALRKLMALLYEDDTAAGLD